MFDFLLLSALVLVLVGVAVLLKMQWTDLATRFDVLDALTGTGGSFETLSAMLFTSPVSPGDQLVFDDLDAKKATFTGSAPIVVVWGDPALTPSNQPFQESQLLRWICTADPDDPQDCYGVYYFNGTTLKGIDVFPAPVRIAREFDSVQWVATAP